MKRFAAMPAIGHRIVRETAGVTAVEFALVAPVFFMLLLGTLDTAHMVYARAILAGAVERAAREASLETGDTDDADAMVEAMIRPVLPNTELEATRSSYFDFADIGRPEQFDDENGNDLCDEGESYVDENRSGVWEADVGVSGNGSASDVVIYTVTATYAPLFRVPFMPDDWVPQKLTARAVKKNQPFGNQQSYASLAGTCTD